MVRHGGLLAVHRCELGETIFNAAPGTPKFEEASCWVGAVNGMYNLVTIFAAALALIPLAQRFGAKRGGVVALILGGLGLLAAANATNQYAILVPMIGLGIAWASMLGIPYIMVASMVPKERAGVYMGIVNNGALPPDALSRLLADSRRIHTLVFIEGRAREVGPHDRSVAS